MQKVGGPNEKQHAKITGVLLPTSANSLFELAQKVNLTAS